jgi:hypothetical protein
MKLSVCYCEFQIVLSSLQSYSATVSWTVCKSQAEPITNAKPLCSHRGTRECVFFCENTKNKLVNVMTFS